MSEQPNFIPPEPEPGSIPARLKAATDRLIRAIDQSKAEWMDKCMEQLLPPEIYALAKSDKGRHRMKVQTWLVENKIHRRLGPEGEALMRGEEVLAEFKVVMQDGKVNIVERRLTSPPDKAQGEAAV
jgi:hypothetical protein